MSTLGAVAVMVSTLLSRVVGHGTVVVSLLSPSLVSHEPGTNAPPTVSVVEGASSVSCALSKCDSNDDGTAMDEESCSVDESLCKACRCATVGITAPVTFRTSPMVGLTGLVL